jgi:hypothetical protein
MSDSGEERYVRWAPLRTAALRDPEEAARLRAAAKDLQRVVSDAGWAYVHRWLATEQQKTLTYLLRSPGDDRADTYALKKAHAAGYAEGLRHAFTTPHAILAQAEQVARDQQRAAELAVQEGTG